MKFPNAPEIVSTKDKYLAFTDAKQQAKFELGVSCAIFLWKDLETCVDQNWGGPDSAEKREWMVGTIIDLFESQEVSIEEIEYRLLGIMEDEFEVNLETGTAYEVARQVMGVYQACKDEDYGPVDELYKEYDNWERMHIATRVQVQDDLPSAEEESELDESEDAMEVDGEATQQGPIIDDDGFELVQRRRR